MSSKNLIDIIKAYQGSSQVKVEVYFKNGKMSELSSLSLEGNHFIFQNGTKVPYSMISHAEISAA